MTGDAPKLPEQLARQVLARAAQLDEKERMSVSVDELRAAAVEAGISSTALDQALSEIAREQTASEARAIAKREQPRTSRRWGLVAVILVLGLLMATFGVRSPKTDHSAWASRRSPSGVEVPCGLTRSTSSAGTP